MYGGTETSRSIKTVIDEKICRSKIAGYILEFYVVIMHPRIFPGFLHFSRGRVVSCTVCKCVYV